MSTIDSDKFHKRLLLVAGTVSMAAGIIGIFMPILPTTPFLLLAAACYMRSSDRFYRWLVNNKLLGAYIRHYIKGTGMPLKAKLFTILLLWITISLSIWIGTENSVVRIVLIIVATGVTLHIILIKPKKKTETLL